MKNKVKENSAEYKKKKLIEELWRIRIEEKFTDWSDVKKKLKL